MLELAGSAADGVLLSAGASVEFVKPVEEWVPAFAGTAMLPVNSTG